MSLEGQDPDTIRITLEDLDQVQPARAEDNAGPSHYGSIAPEAAAPLLTEERGSFFMRSWVYLGVAGLTGSLLAWAICEPWFVDRGRHTWANFLLFPLMLILSSACLGIAESVVDRSPKRAMIRGLLSLALGAALGFFLFVLTGLIFAIGLGFLRQVGGYTVASPGLWIVRSIAWSIFGIGGGLVYGIVGQSAKRCLYGILGGMLGAGLGGLLFDPISIPLHGAALSRAVGMALFGAATGVAIGLVESAFKDRWLYVAAGPLAGKQFILYKPVSLIGSDTSSDLYLFKDPAIQSRHAQVELRGPRVVLRPFAPVLINGRPVGETVLHSGDYLQIGRYGFHYRDRERASR